VTLALPGARAEQIRIEVNGRGLQIETVVPPPVFSDGMSVVRLEIPYGRMIRRIDLPTGRYTVLEHRLEHGCLFLRLTRPVP
jgi:HSP20 family molecular chaperone IbpA